MPSLLHLLFFLSGISGLIYQVVWVRLFGHVFGNTIYSAAIVVAVFMLGLGAGSYLLGSWSDRRYVARPQSLLRAYGIVELVIAALGLAITWLLPHLGQLSATISDYAREPGGWFVLTTASYLTRGAIAVVILAPITLLMGGTLTLLIRHLVRADLSIGGSRIAVLYAVNTAGAAAGALATDFVLVPGYGLRDTQLAAVALNVLAGLGALWLARATPDRVEGRQRSGEGRHRRKVAHGLPLPPVDASPRVTLYPVAVALVLAGFAAMGMEILWFRHFTVMLGQFRAVFSLLLAIILAGIGLGSLAAAWVHRRSDRPAAWFAMAQALFVVSTLFGLFIADSGAGDATMQAGLSSMAGVGRAAGGAWSELWFNARPMLIEVALPALLMGFSFPLANAIVQRAEASVGRRAGVLYFANTVGAVTGSLAVGFLLLPTLGMQTAATILMVAAALTILPVRAWAEHRPTALAAIGLTVIAIGGWALLPADHVMRRALPRPAEGERLLTLDEGVNEIIGVVESADGRRTLMTNGHAMSSTLPLAQRYMRALAHVPLLMRDAPRDALIIGFGVGNTTHAATLHPSVERIEIADLSTDVLAHAGYFRAFNHDALRDPRVSVHVNDGRQHLLMRPEAAYDLVTLEPPPIGYAGVSALYSTEFYTLARSRLKPGGFLSQWLPAYQVPTATTLAMVRAFIDVFPDAVLLSGAEADLVLVGGRDARVQIDPVHLTRRLAEADAVREDLQRVDLGSAVEIAGMFVASAETMRVATRESPPVTDDRPIQEYGVLSLLNFGEAVPGSIVDLREVAAWCPGCYEGGRPIALVQGLDAYLALLEQAYAATPEQIRTVQTLATRGGRRLAGSAYLGAIVPETAATHNVIGLSLAQAGRLEDAIVAFTRALALDPRSADTHWHLGAALASTGRTDMAVQHLREAVRLAPGHAQARNDLGALLFARGDIQGAMREFEGAVATDPEFAEARANLERARVAAGRAR